MNIIKITEDQMNTVTPAGNYWGISCGDHCMSANPNWWRMVPPTAKDKISAKEMTLQTRAGAFGAKGKLGRANHDKCVEYNCGCVGQSSSQTKLAAAALAAKILNRFKPGATNDQLVTITNTTAIAANMFGPNFNRP